MADVVVFHHAQGLTPGVLAFADELRAAGHRVATPDLYAGATFDTLEAGIAHAEQLGFDTVIERGVAAAGPLPSTAACLGFSLGVMPAQKLAQTRGGTKGAILLHACVPPEYFGPWPPGLPLQIHVMENDRLGDVDVARELAATVDTAELFLYPGERHLFTDRSLGEHDPDAAALLMRRVLAFLQRLA
ncbi:dienelactone hydrolase family protein [Rhodanobacter geophilus]